MTSPRHLLSVFTLCSAHVCDICSQLSLVLSSLSLDAGQACVRHHTGDKGADCFAAAFKTAKALQVQQVATCLEGCCKAASLPAL